MSSGVAVYEGGGRGRRLRLQGLQPRRRDDRRAEREDIIGRRLSEAFPGVKDFGLFKLLQQVWRTGEPAYLPESMYRDEHSPGTWRENWVYKLPEGDIVAVYNDITERQKADQALRESEERYRKLVEASPDAIVIHGHGEIFFVNPAAISLLGASSSADLIGTSVYDLVHPDSMKLMDERTEALKKHLPIPQQVIRMIRRDGMVLDIETTALPLDYQGRLSVLAFLHDITRRKRAREALESRERFLNNVIEYTPNPLWISDEKGTIIRINQALRDLLKITDSSVVGRYNVLQDAQVIEQGLLDKVKSVFEEGQTVNFRIDYYTEREPQIKSRRRAHRTMDMVMSAIVDETGKVTNALCQHKDVTEQIRAEEEHKQLLEYQEMDQLKTNILSTVSHELRTPLASIKGYAHPADTVQRKAGRRAPAGIAESHRPQHRPADGAHRPPAGHLPDGRRVAAAQPGNGRPRQDYPHRRQRDADAQAPPTSCSSRWKSPCRR